MVRLHRLTFLLFLALLSQERGVAQSSPEPSAVTADSLTNLLAPGYFEERISALTNRTDLPDDVAASAIQLYGRSLALVREYDQLEEERAKLIKTAEGASNELRRARAALEVPLPVAGESLDNGVASQVLEQKISELQAELQLADAERSRLQAEPKRRADRKLKIAELIAEYRTAYAELDRQGSSGENAEVPTEFAEAVSESEVLQQEVYLRRIRNLNLELASYDATSDLVLARQALASRRAEALSEQLALLKQQLSARRTEESTRAEEAANRARERARALQLPQVTQLAETNHALAQTRVAISRKLAKASADLDEVEAQTRALVSSFDSVRTQVETVQELGVPQDKAIGMALRQEQYSLPSRKRQESDIQSQREDLAEAQLEWFRISRERQLSATPETQLTAIEATLPPELSAPQREQAVTECRRLLEEQRALLADLSEDYDSLGELLTRLTLAQKNYLETVEDFRGYISERVLWIQSTARLTPHAVGEEVAAIHDLLGAELREGLLPYLRRDLRKHPAAYVGILLLLAGLFASRPALARGLTRLCSDQPAYARLSVRPALLGLAYTLALALPLVVLLVFLGVRLADYSGGTELADKWSQTLYRVATAFLLLEVLRQLCRRPGLATAYLHWPEHNVRLLRFHFTWFLIVAVPLGILTDLLEGVFAKDVSNRLLFIIVQCLIMLVGHALLRTRGGLRFNLHDGQATAERPLKLQGLYHALAILIPGVLILMSVMGYTYTARSIWLRVGESIRLGIVVLLTTMLVLHWLTVLRRRLAVKKAQPGGETEQQEQPGPDIWHVYSASRRFFSTLLWIVMGAGLLVIWSDMLPALKKLEHTPLPFVSRATSVEGGHPSTVSVGMPDLEPPGGETNERGQTRPAPSFDRADFVSVGDALLAVVVLFLTIVASRNLPGFVEMVLLSRIRFRQGEGYAIVTVLRYAVLLVGLGWTLTLIGITWNKVQWLAAAITVGIGFGLQEIFANFVSGLILLFERPVRVGDIITAGDVTGTVTRIQMRATTIRNWDQQEMIIPNKDLVTGQVINWTLTNDVSRIALTVGVSYDADVKRASDLLLKIAQENANVRRDPAPFVTFEEFGDSTLNLVLRAYVSIEVRLSTKNQLNTAILEQFRQAGIEIAYPQRDLHLRTVAADLRPFPITGKPSDASPS